jgi:hypothetical protein
MTQTFARPRRPLEVPDGDPQGTLGLIGAVPPADGAWTNPRAAAAGWILKLIDEAMTATAQRKVICATIGVDKSLLRRQLALDGHLSVWRLGALDDTFWLNLASGIREHFGMLDREELIAEADALADRARQLYAKAARR